MDYEEKTTLITVQVVAATGGRTAFDADLLGIWGLSIKLEITPLSHTMDRIDHRDNFTLKTWIRIELLKGFVLSGEVDSRKRVCRTTIRWYRVQEGIIRNDATGWANSYKIQYSITTSWTSGSWGRGPQVNRGRNG